MWPSRYAVRAGFDWGLDYLLMPLYAAAFFYSGILAREAFALRGSRLARLLTTLGGRPDRGCDSGCGGKCAPAFHGAVGPTDQLASTAFTVSSAKWMAVYVGLLLLAAALFAQRDGSRPETRRQNLVLDP